MKIVLDTKDLTEGLEEFSEDLITQAESKEDLQRSLPVLEGASAFVAWILSNYCNNLSNVAESEISETLKQYKKCMKDPENDPLYIF